MKCPICDKEFYGIGFLTHNNKTLCKDCIQFVIQEHAKSINLMEAKKMNNENTFDEVCEDCDNGTDLPCVACQYEEFANAYGMTK
jgi:hypothetical protein